MIKGLFIKDLRLMMVQRSFFLLIVLMGLFIGVFTENVSFIIGYLTFAGGIFTVTTMSYDEFDNGNAYLFTLPITKKGYVVEKYIFGMTIGITSWIIAMIMSITIYMIKGGSIFNEIVMSGLSVIPAMIFIVSVMIPIQLKFGGERGRVAVLALLGAMMAIGISIVNILTNSGVSISSINISDIGMNMAILLFTIISFIMMGISYIISVGVIKRKEF